MRRTYNIPLRSAFRNTPRYKKTPKAVRALKAFLVRHMKADEDMIKIGRHLNEKLWANGIRNPPHHVEVDVEKTEDGLVKVELKGQDYVEQTKEEFEAALEAAEKAAKKKVPAVKDTKESTEDKSESEIADKEEKAEVKEEKAEVKKVTPKKAPAKKSVTAKK